MIDRSQYTTAIILISFLLLVSFSFYPQGAEVSLECNSPRREVLPGSVTTLAFSLTNQGDTSDTYEVSLTLPQGFSALSAPNSVEVEARGSRILLVSVLSSPSLASGTYQVLLSAKSRSEPAQTSEAKASIKILQRAEVGLQLPSGRASTSGEDLNYRFRVVNRGNAIDSFRLKVNTSWKAKLSQTLVQVPPGEAVEVSLALSVPETAEPGSETLCQVSARSVSNPKVSTQGEIWTSVLPSPPEEVGGTLFPIVSTTSGWAITGGETGISTRASLAMAGKIGPERYLSLNGTVNNLFSLKDANRELEEGRMDYREPDWGLSLGTLSLATPVMDIEGRAVGYHYHPRGKHYGFSLYGTEDKSFSLSYSWELPSRSLELYLLPPEDLALSASLGDIGLDLKLGKSSSSFSVSNQGKPAFVGTVSWNSGTTISLSTAFELFSGQLSLTRGGQVKKTHSGFWLSVPFTEGSFETHGEITRKQGANLDTLDTEFSVSFRREEKALSWEVFSKLKNSSDFISGTDAGTISAGVNTSFQFDQGWRLSLGTTLSQDVGNPKQVTSEQRLGLTVPFDGGEAELDWKIEGENHELDLSLTSGGKTLELTKKSSQFTLSLQARFSSPFPLVRSKGRIEGRVFVDENLNGVQDPGEKGPEGLLLRCDGGRAVTGKGGDFRFRPMPPGKYKLRFLNLSSNYSPRPSTPIPIRVSAGEAESIKIRLLPTATLSGRVLAYRRANGNGFNNDLDSEEIEWMVDRPLARAKVVLTNNEKAYTLTTDGDGAFYIQGLPPGKWKLRVKLPSLKQPYHTEKKVYTLNLGPGTERRIKVRVLPKLREIQPLDGL